jgi:hypothetical protein
VKARSIAELAELIGRPLSPTATHRRQIMHKRQATRLAGLRAVQSFLTSNAEWFPEVANSRARKQFDDLIEELRGHVEDQEGSFLSAKSSTRKVHRLRRALLRDYMTPIARIAAMERDSVPELDPVRLPEGTLSLDRLIAYALGMAAIAAEHPEPFVAAGLPDDFAERLIAAAEDVNAEVGNRIRTRGRRGGATKGLESQLRRARRLLGVLDAFVTTALADDPARMADWRIVKRVSGGSRPSDGDANAGIAASDCADVHA